MVSKPDASTNRSRNVLPTSRCSRSASTKLAVASLARFGLAGRPDTIDQRSVVEPSCSSSGMIGRRSTGPTRRPVPVVPVNSRLTLARASSLTCGSAAMSSRSTAPPSRPSCRTKGLFPPTSTSAALIARTNSGYARTGAGGAGEQPQHDPAPEAGDEGDAEPGHPTPAQLGSQACEHRRHSCSFPARSFAGTRLRRHPFRVGGATAKLTAYHPDAGRGTIWSRSFVVRLTTHAVAPTRQDRGCSL